MIDRTYLFVPGNRPERFDKANGAGAHAVILDLEDAVTPADKVAAREAVRA
jgi:citrate lyase subunit beta/citryl-CoA lyase